MCVGVGNVWSVESLLSLLNSLPLGTVSHFLCSKSRVQFLRDGVVDGELAERR